MTDATSLANNLKRVISRIIDARMVSERTSQCAFFGISVVLFAASGSETVPAPKAGLIFPIFLGRNRSSSLVTPIEAA